MTFARILRTCHGLRGAVLPAAAPFVAAGVLVACQPTVRMEAPREPITIHLTIQADIRVRIEEQAQQDIKTYENIF